MLRKSIATLVVLSLASMAALVAGCSKAASGTKEERATPPPANGTQSPKPGSGASTGAPPPSSTKAPGAPAPAGPKAPGK